MTREEAYEILKTGICLICAHGCKNMDDCDISYCGFRDAVKTVMEESCEEAISRQDALDALHMCLSTNSYDDDVTGDSYICYEEAEYEIEKLQSVQPKPIDCEDAISREDALMCMTGEFSPAVIYKPEDIISKRVQRIKALPTVQPSTRTAHNISKFNPVDEFICDKCNLKLSDWLRFELDEETADVSYFEFSFKFCPECGRRIVDKNEVKE